jgi:DNA-directed RNA polymerase specialized sigma subunit
MLEERKKRVRDLYFIEGMTTREIARTERISIRDISAILKEEEVKKQNLEATRGKIICQRIQIVR